jgi:hypothetical protein
VAGILILGGKLQDCAGQRDRLIRLAGLEQDATEVKSQMDVVWCRLDRPAKRSNKRFIHGWSLANLGSRRLSTPANQKAPAARCGPGLFVRSN